MKPTRRGFIGGVIGGCIARVATKTIPCAEQVRTARYWLQTKKVYGGWCGLRNDGNLFFAIGKYSTDRDLTLYDSGTSSSVTDSLLLNEFLESSCDCGLGHFCERHAYMDGGALHPKKHNAADRPDTTMPEFLQSPVNPARPLKPPLPQWATVKEKTIVQEWTELTCQENKRATEKYLACAKWMGGTPTGKDADELRKHLL